MGRRLEAGAKAPGFDILNYDGKLLSLSQFAGRKVWLAFYRYSSCPLCLDHFSEVVFRHDAIRESGAEFIAVFESKTIDLRHNPCRKANVFYPMITDPEKRLYELYGVEQSLLRALHPAVAYKLARALMHGFPQGAVDGALSRIPAHFLIEPNGDLHTVHYGSHIADQIPWWKVARFMQKKGPQTGKDPWAQFYYR